MKIFNLSTLVTAATIAVVACGSNLGTTPGSDAGDAGDAGGNPKPDAGGNPKPDAGDAGTVDESFVVGGTVTGLLGTGLVLQNNLGDDVAVSSNGTFKFPTKLAKGAAFSVSIKTQPTAPTQTCAVSGGTGTIANGDAMTVTVNCAVDKFTVGGTISGLAGSGLVLQNAGGDDLIVNSNGTFAFPTALASGGAYAVTVKTQPGTPSQTCVVTNGSGSVASANVSNVAIVCTTNDYTIGGTVTGLSGSGLVLKLNGGESLPISGPGPFTFTTPIASNTSFAVTVSAQPTNPTQTCVVTGGSGTVGGANVSTVTVNCDTTKFAIGGTATGLLGNATLQNNGGDDITVGSDGKFSFPTPIESNGTYAVTIKTQPGVPSQTCSLSNASGTVAAAPIEDVVLSCVTNSFKVKGHVTGLAGTGLSLQDNNGDDLAVNASGDFEFVTPVLSGQPYAVTVKTQPTNLSQTCTVSNGNGTMGAADVTNVTVDCATNAYTVGGSIAGLGGSGLTLTNNLGDDLVVPAGATSFTFATSILSGADYAVTVKNQPSDPTQNCVVTAGSGTVTNGNVVTVMVNCTTSTFAVGGHTSGLAGVGLVLQNNAGDDLTINNNNTYAFSQPIASNGAYSVTVKTQPVNPSQTCTVANASGTVTNAAITNADVTCVTNTYKVGGTLSGLASGTLVLQNNAGDDLSLSANAAFSFNTKVPSNGAYAVTIKTVPNGNYCAVTSGSGTVGAADVTSVRVKCVQTPPSCKALPGGSASGVYTIDPDGAGPGAPFATYCDMVTDGGGWTLMLNRIVTSDQTGQPDLNQTLGAFDNTRATNWQFNITTLYASATSVVFAAKENNSCAGCNIAGYDSAIKLPRSAGAFTTTCNTNVTATFTKLVGAGAGTSGTAYWCDGALAWGNCSSKPCHYGVHWKDETNDGYWSQNQVAEMHFPSAYSSYRQYGTNGAEKWCRSCAGGLAANYNSSSSCCQAYMVEDRSTWTVWVR